MKVEVNENKQVKEREFPKLMVAQNGSIVLFISEKVGTCLNPKIGESFGKYYEGWVMSKFQDFNGSITLSNE